MYQKSCVTALPRPPSWVGKGLGEEWVTWVEKERNGSGGGRVNKGDEITNWGHIQFLRHSLKRFGHTYDVCKVKYNEEARNHY